MSVSLGQIFVVSAPSGAGKTTLVKALRQELTGLSVCISHTTRPRRDGERDGVDYHFVSHEDFNKMAARGEFVEYATVFDNLYGTSRAAVAAARRHGDILLEIDWQGAQQIRRESTEVTSVFVLPPSLTTLKQRLDDRGRDSEEVIAKRMRAALQEITHFHEFDYSVVNDDFARALGDLVAIVRATRLRTLNQQAELSARFSEPS